MNNRNPATGWVLLAAALTCLGGCGPGDTTYKTVRLSGKVSVDGAPIDKGYISFSPLESGHGPGTGAEIVAGQFVCENVPVGKLQVQFQATKATGRMIDNFGKQEPEMESVIPTAYQSGVEITVVEGESQRDFELSSTGPK